MEIWTKEDLINNLRFILKEIDSPSTLMIVFDILYPNQYIKIHPKGFEISDKRSS